MFADRGPAGLAVGCAILKYVALDAARQHLQPESLHFRVPKEDPLIGGLRRVDRPRGDLRRHRLSPSRLLTQKPV